MKNRRNLIIKIVLCFNLVAVSMQASIVAFDDFSGGTAGTSIIGQQDTLSYGTWTGTSTTPTGTLGGAEYGSGDYAVSPDGAMGGAVLAGDFSHVTLGQDIVKVSVDLTPRAHSTYPQGILTIGFYETIHDSKGQLFNWGVDDMASFRYQFQNSNNSNNEGKATWKIFDEGVSQSGSWFGPDAFENGANFVINMELAYNFVTGETVASVYHDGTLIASDTKTVTGLGDFNYVGFGWSGLDTSMSTADPSQVTNFTVEAVPEPTTIGVLLASVAAFLGFRRRRKA
ncbi:MAG: PEP-CTERM sorting domain-containing protein [Verrucomicrobiales bacterium]|nr:PEP-CTERM sorting domain-containing protein [Verrucomicrobiales bacterium]